MPIDEARAFVRLTIAVLTISDTRTPETDTSGDILAGRIAAKGHVLGQRAITADTVDGICEILNAWCDDAAVDVIITTGGTGLTGRDVTPEALDRLKTKDIPGFGEMFRWVSMDSIGTSTIQSRACAVLAGKTYIFALPGSNGAVRDGWDRILSDQLDSRHTPCNFVQLITRLSES